ncbi:hypothetical protein CEXT_363141 [Caerostris extrusa]|uniref:Uncharacterized protein n=1 Tax=Caerostris extrusa TaxID=172846 RepID=A0AAV4XR45_CAEEX|nr:hypothetical protein CEXT_363141 [Caerostris extrusa]
MGKEFWYRWEFLAAECSLASLQKPGPAYFFHQPNALSLARIETLNIFNKSSKHRFPKKSFLKSTEMLLRFKCKFREAQISFNTRFGMSCNFCREEKMTRLFLKF